MAMWQGLKDGWGPPESVSNEMYDLAKEQYKKGIDHGFSDADLGFIGFGASFGGKWWGGFGRDRKGDRDHSYEGARALMWKWYRTEKGATFFCADFITTEPPEERMVIYCDPPYLGSTGYSTGKFNHEAFWEKVRRLENNGHVVLVSEYQAPDDFSCVLTIKVNTTMDAHADKGQERIEKLFRFGQHTPAQLAFRF